MSLQDDIAALIIAALIRQEATLVLPISRRRWNGASMQG
jgi:hypothetical protein